VYIIILISWIALLFWKDIASVEHLPTLLTALHLSFFFSNYNKKEVLEKNTGGIFTVDCSISSLLFGMTVWLNK
jgi:hypothetical protein